MSSELGGEADKSTYPMDSVAGCWSVAGTCWREWEKEEIGGGTKAGRIKNERKASRDANYVGQMLMYFSVFLIVFAYETTFGTHPHLTSTAQIPRAPELGSQIAVSGYISLLFEVSSFWEKNTATKS